MEQGFSPAHGRLLWFCTCRRVLLPASTCAPVAQLDRASASGAEGHRFESCRAHQPSLACSRERASAGKPARSRHCTRRLSAVAMRANIRAEHCEGGLPQPDFATLRPAIFLALLRLGKPSASAAVRESSRSSRGYGGIGASDRDVATRGHDDGPQRGEVGSGAPTFTGLPLARGATAMLVSTPGAQAGHRVSRQA